MLWEAVFMLVVLKIPIVYLCAVVWTAVRAEPAPPGEPSVGARLPVPEPPAPTARDAVRRRGRVPRTGGGPARRPAPARPRVASASAEPRR